MNLYSFFVPLRTAIAALLLACTAGQSAHAAVFDREPTAGDALQLATAVLSLPASAAAIAYPDSKALACTEHTIKAINEFLAVMNDNDYHLHPAAWLVYDVIQAITALRTTPAKLTPDATNDNANVTDFDDYIDDDAAIKPTNNGHDKTDEDEESPSTPHVKPQDWEQFKRVARYVLAGAEALTRAKAASTNNNAYYTLPTNTNSTDYRGQYLWNQRELLHSFTSLTRLASYYLSTEKQSYKTIFIVLFIANIIDLVVRIDATQTAHSRYVYAEQQGRNGYRPAIPPHTRRPNWENPYNYVTTPAAGTIAAASPATTAYTPAATAPAWAPQPAPATTTWQQYRPRVTYQAPRPVVTIHAPDSTAATTAAATTPAWAPQSAPATTTWQPYRPRVTYQAPRPVVTIHAPDSTAATTAAATTPAWAPQPAPATTTWQPYRPRVTYPTTRPVVTIHAPVGPAATTTAYTPAATSPAVTTEQHVDTKMPAATETKVAETKQEEPDECLICLNALSEPVAVENASLTDRTTIRKHSCRKRFHTYCINGWINNPNRKEGTPALCPNCQAELKEADLTH